MHMAMVITGGIVLLGVFLLFGKLWGGDAIGSATATKVFLPVWLAIAVVNLWVGVSKAGYTIREELPILLIVIRAAGGRRGRCDLAVQPAVRGHAL